MSATLLVIGLVFGILIGALARVAEFFIMDTKRRGKARIIWWDQDAGELKIEFYDRKGNEVTIGKGESAKTYILDAHARMPGRWPTWFIHPRYGWNYVALSDAETVNADGLIRKLAISNPATYHNAISRNKAQQALRANDPDDRWAWVVPVAIVGAVALVAVLGIVGWIAVKLGSGAGGA